MDQEETNTEGASASFDPGNLSSRYSEEVEVETEESSSNDLEPDPIDKESSSESKPLFDAHDSFHNVDQTVNLMDANADTYSTQKMATPHNSRKTGWSGAGRPEKIRRETWDTSLMGRLTVWLIFFATMFLFTFVIPYLLMDVMDNEELSSDAAHRAAEPQTPSLDLSDDGFLFKDASRIDNIKTVILQSGLTSEKTLQDQSSKQYYAVRWLSDTDPARVEPLVNHHDNTELLQRFALAVMYYSTSVDAELHSLGMAEETLGNILGDTVEAEEAEAEPSQDAGGWTVSFQSNSTPNSTPNSTTAETTSEVQSAHLEQHEEEPQLDSPESDSELGLSVHLEGHGDTEEESALPMLSLGRSGEESERVVRVERNEQNRKLNDDPADAMVAWAQDTSWMSSANICDWYGVTCDDDETVPDEQRAVVALDLDSFLLQGTIPSEILALSKLTSLELSRNFLSGKIPTKLWSTLPLESFRAFGNMLSGSIHSDLQRMTNLIELDLSHNMMITGSIPTRITNLRRLRSLQLEGNQLSGTIPPMVELVELNTISFSSNRLTGSIPIHLFQLKKLLDLGLADNLLVGTFPPEIDSLQFLRTLDLSGNRMGGELPEVFLRLIALKSLNLSGNRFKNLPTSMGLLNQLESLVLSSNDFKGKIPDEWSGMTSLLNLSLDQNDVTGTIPAKVIRRMRSLQVLRLDQNSMTGTLPIELEYLQSLKTLTLSDNSFTGVIPHVLGTLDSLETLELTDTSLTGTMPPEVCEARTSGSLARVTADCGAVECDCCDNC